MKRTALALILALSFSAVAILQSVSLARANPGPWGPATPNTDPPTLIVQSPQYNTTYYDNDVLLSFTVKLPYTWTGPSYITEVNYGLDGQVCNLWNRSMGTFSPTQMFAMDLNVSRGQHTLQVNVHAQSDYYPDPNFFVPTIYPMDVTQTIPLTVDAGPFIPLSVSVTSPASRTYNTTEIPLNFTVKQSVSQIAYSLDGQDNVTVTEDTMLTGLSEGTHTLTVYAEDITGNVGTSETINFTIAKEPEAEPFQTALVATASGVSVGVIGIGLLIYFKKRKR